VPGSPFNNGGVFVDWGIRTIYVPQSYLSFVSGTLYSLDTDLFHADLRDLEDDEEGIPFPDTHNFSDTVTVAGTTYAPFITIINGYQVVFQDGQYAVRLDGSNNNIFDEGIIIRNQVSIIPTNSAGLQIVTQGSGLSPGEQLQLDEIHGQTKRAIYIDTTAVAIGDGYQQTPHNTLAAGLTDASTNNLSQIHLKGSATTAADLSSLSFFGRSTIGSSLTLNNATTDGSTQFHNTDVQGTITGAATFESSIIRNLTTTNIIANNSLLTGTISLPAGSPGSGNTTYLIDCRDGGTSSPAFDFSNAGTHTLNMKDYSGRIALENMAPGDVADVTLDGGQITVAATCTGGTITVRGIGTLTDNSGGVVTINEDNLIYQAGGISRGGM
jgi:hypothetical protein